MQPCGVVVAGNRSADKEANEARELAKIGQLGGVKYCAGGERFFFTWQGGMIIEGLGQFVREREESPPWRSGPSGRRKEQ